MLKLCVDEHTQYEYKHMKLINDIIVLLLISLSRSSPTGPLSHYGFISIFLLPQKSYKEDDNPS